ncbi:putative secreted protein (Por secretion system target) [Gramella sp. Hel_I_59]|uniref:HYR domain-containing protein n=1 Tax=Gramella sp. Hel_I_59 TaxID=1249978 RepID=UPI00116679BC|nr:HYR domain-containing protein [Gramella sp. Hel_I_59]TQI71449.1 putative secreted protein (Por secretion system target) [Gramella sp. Hel_I_59]
MINAADIPYHKSSFLRKVCISLFLILFFSSNSFGQDPSQTVPSYNWLNKVDLVDQTLTSLDTDEIPISIDVSPDNFLYILTFGNGIQKRNSDGTIVRSNFINGLSSPLDFVIDNEGFFYVADYSEDSSCSENGKIKIFEPGGNLDRIIYTGLYRPLGIDVDSEGNIYVAEYNPPGNGCEGDELSRVSVYNQNGVRIAQNKSVIRPYRIAVSAEKKVYLSQEGGDDPAVLTLDSNLDITGSLPNVQSPGSINIDSFGYIHVVEYAGRIDFSQFINFENLRFGEIQDIAEEIDDGIDDNSYFIRIYDHTENFERNVTERIEFPVDLAFGNCDRMYVDNAYADGRNTIFGYLPEEFEFDLEIYKRTPGFDEEDPIINCPENLVLEIAEGENEVEVTYSIPIATDQNNVEVEIIAGPESGERKTEGVYNVVFEATDLCGNKARCTFKITVNGSEIEDTPPEFENCSPNITENNDPGECGAVVTFDTPRASDESGNVEVTRVDENTDLVSGSLFPVGTITITFQANDETNDPVECSFDIIVEDNENPKFLSCPTNINETVPFGESGKVINYDNPTFDDNCPGTTIIQNAGLPTGSEFPIGSTTNTFEITDKIGNTATCSFNVTITEQAEDTPPVFDNCSPNITEENDPGECGAVVNFDLPTASDESGSLAVTKIDNSGLNSGDLFPVGRTTITFQANDGTNDPVTCSFDIVVQDTEAPNITCRSDFSVPSEPGQNFAIVNFNTPSATDNCGIESVLQTQGLASGSQFNVGSHTITFEATDLNGLTSDCSFEFEVQPPNLAPSIECPNDISVTNDSGICGAVVEFEEPTVTDPEGDELTMTRTDDTGLNSGDIFPVGTTTLSYEVSDGINDPVTCRFTITVESTEQPNFISCPNDISELLDASETGKIITFDSPEFEDNCSEAELFQTEGPSSGEFFELGETEVRFELRINNTVVDQCSFSVNLVRQTATFQCIETITVNIGEDAQNSSVTEIPTSDFILSDSSNLDFELNVQQFTCEDIGTLDLPIRATDRETGEEYSCTVEVTVRDVGAPLIICPAGKQEREIPANANFVLPQIADRLSIIDNCADFEDLEIIQDPPEGTLYANAGDYIVMITATDPAGNTEECQVTYRLTLEEEPQEFALNCPQNESVIKADDNCEYIVPDFSNTIIYSPANANFSQSIAPGTRIEQSTSIEINVSFNGEFDSCTFDLVLKDNTSPMLSCPEDRMIVVAEGESIAIPDYRGELEVSDNCGLAEIIQDPAPGTQISEDTEVSFIAFDISNTNNASECSFMLTLAVDTEGNDIPIANEDFYSTPVNTTLNISAEEGVLANDMDADGDELTATLVENVTNGTLEFESDGSFVYTPDDGFIGDDSFTYYVFDGFTEVETTVTISVVPVDTGGFQCVETYVIELDENGTALLQINELYTGDASEVTFSLDQEIYDCDDLGANQVTLSYSGAENGSCVINIEVVDRIKPEIELQNIGIDLDLSGNATITPEDVIVSFSDNCDNDLSYELSRSTFSCKDLGWNEINVIATDASGNSTTTAVEVQVFAESGICNGTTEGSEYIFIYPNPNQGSFKVATPFDVTISRIEVFDHRGRFITGKDFAPNVGEYAISTGPLQEAVYVVKMITNEGEKTKRFIIKN